ncbi:MAG: hypothetical protein O2954_18245 [bacterium]|nr:hypothetical protein [bacterium]
MSVQMIIELPDGADAQTIVQALEAYKARLKASIERAKRQLAVFESRYGVNTDHFLNEMAAEDLEDGDLEYVQWAGEARLLDGLKAELQELENARYQLP